MLVVLFRISNLAYAPIKESEEAMLSAKTMKVTWPQGVGSAHSWADCHFDMLHVRVAAVSIPEAIVLRKKPRPNIFFIFAVEFYRWSRGCVKQLLWTFVKIENVFQQDTDVVRRSGSVLTLPFFGENENIWASDTNLQSTCEHPQ